MKIPFTHMTCTQTLDVLLFYLLIFLLYFSYLFHFIISYKILISRQTLMSTQLFGLSQFKHMNKMWICALGLE